MFEIFHRTWWRDNPAWPDGLEPCVGESFFIGKAKTEEEAIQMCKEWNDCHDAGRYSDKAEFMKI